MIKDSSLCGLGQSAPNPVLSTLANFRDEYVAHIKDKKCPAGECKALASIEIIPELCKGCGICKRQCPVNAITGEVKQPHKINPEVTKILRLVSNDNLNTVLDYDVSEDNKVDNVPFIIYNSSLESKHYSDYSTYVNIVPTLANLFDINYDSRLYMGQDLLSEEYESIAVFADGSWINEIGFYDTEKGKMKYYTDYKYSNEEILDINNKVSLKLKMSSSAIKNNYFNYLNEQINNYNENVERDNNEQISDSGISSEE